MNILLEILIFIVVVYAVVGISMVKKGKLRRVDEKSNDRKAWLFCRLYYFADGTSVLDRWRTYFCGRLAARIHHVGGRDVVRCIGGGLPLVLPQQENDYPGNRRYGGRIS